MNNISVEDIKIPEYVTFENLDKYDLDIWLYETLCLRCGSNFVPKYFIEIIEELWGLNGKTQNNKVIRRFLDLQNEFYEEHKKEK